MSRLQWTALGTAVAGGGVLVAAPWPTVHGTAFTTAAGLVLLIAGGCLWRVAADLQTELATLRTRLAGLARSGAQPADPLASRFGLDGPRRAIEAATARLRDRVRELEDRCLQLQQAARAGELQQMQLDAMLEGVSDAVIVTDALNEIAAANRSAGRLLDFDAKAAVQRPIDKVLRDPQLLKLIRDARRSGDPTAHHVEHRIRAAGEDALYRVRVAPITASDLACTDGPAGVLTVLNPVAGTTDAGSDSGFLANVSHEMRTPLTSIRAYLEMLIDGEALTEEDCAHFHHVILGEVNRLAGLVENLLTIHRIESGLACAQREVVSLTALATEAVDAARPLANARQVALIVEPADGPTPVFADRELLLQALGNLLDNAIKYTPEGGRIELQIASTAGSASVTITDTGIGVPAGQIPRLFEKFFRVTDHKTVAPGTGLGLNLVQQVIETIHGGRLSVRSTVGAGSAFTFTLPMADNL